MMAALMNNFMNKQKYKKLNFEIEFIDTPRVSSFLFVDLPLASKFYLMTFTPSVKFLPFKRQKISKKIVNFEIEFNAHPSSINFYLLTPTPIVSTIN